ncbi:MAG: Peptidyl-prolyl cis-trans isomerase, partial [Alphaproteobacteria bacterium]|nr:Peptidyl-prolyl cis-trans isomerase [Alphaproteobacteria bacterium]
TDAKAFFEENKENYRVPETSDVAVLVLPQSLFIKDAAIPENEIRAYYDAHKDQFMSPERARLEQVVAPDEKAAKAIMEAKPASLEKYKDDKNQFLKADWYGRNIMPKDFIKTLYPAKPAGLVGPIKTALGWHVLNVISYEDAKPLSFDEAKATIAEQLKAQKNDEQMNVFSGELDELIASEPSLEAIATKYNQKTETISGLSINEAGEQLKKSALPTAVQQRVKEAAFTLESDEISPLLDSSAGDYALVQIKRIVPAAIPEFAAVRDRVTADAQKSRDAKDLTALSEKLIGLYDAKKPEAFDKAVKEAGLTVQPLPPSDKAAVTAKFNKETAELLFTLSPENPLSYTQNSGTTTLLRLRDILPSSEAPDDKTKTTLNDAIKNNVIQELQQQFLAGWQQQLGIKVNEQVLKNTFGPQAQAEKE